MDMKPQHCPVFLHLAWLDTKNSVVYVLLEYLFNNAETYQVGSEGYRKLRRLLRNNRLDSHADQIRYTAIGKQGRKWHRQAK